MRTRSLVLLTALLAAATLGCSKTDTSSTTAAGGSTTAKPATSGSSQAPATTASSGTTPGTTRGTTPGTTTGTAAGGPVKIALADSPLGKILVDGKGMTIYMFAKDTATTSACTANCAMAWPAVTGTTVDPGTGLDKEDFATIKGQEGADQIVFYGHPLYVYSADSGPGETTGQGVGGNWYVIGADGNPIKTKP